MKVVAFRALGRQKWLWQPSSLGVSLRLKQGIQPREALSLWDGARRWPSWKAWYSYLYNGKYHKILWGCGNNEKWMEEKHLTQHSAYDTLVWMFLIVLLFLCREQWMAPCTFHSSQGSTWLRQGKTSIRQNIPSMITTNFRERTVNWNSSWEHVSCTKGAKVSSVTSIFIWYGHMIKYAAIKMN